MKLQMNAEIMKAQIDVCGQSVAYIAQNASGVVADDVMWSLNQAIIALQDAVKRCGEAGEE